MVEVILRIQWIISSIVKKFLAFVKKQVLRAEPIFQADHFSIANKKYVMAIYGKVSSSVAENVKKWHI